ncbi:hypothetical protein STEG23_026374 [Scotinomys teguina]
MNSNLACRRVPVHRSAEAELFVLLKYFGVWYRFPGTRHPFLTRRSASSDDDDDDEDEDEDDDDDDDESDFWYLALLRNTPPVTTVVNMTEDLTRNSHSGYLVQL